MKTVKKILYGAILASLGGIAYGMEEKAIPAQGQAIEAEKPILKFPNTYKGMPITPSTLTELMPEAPEEIKKEVELYEKEKPGRLQWYATVDMGQGMDFFRAERERKKEIFGTENMSNGGHNYIFKLNEEGNYLAQISGENNRIMGILVSHPDRPITRDNGNVMGDFNRDAEFRKSAFNKVIEQWKKLPINTYQTASRAAAALVINGLGFGNVKAPKTYLMPVAGEKLTSIADNDCLVVQEYIKDAKPLDEMTQDEIEKISPETFADYVKVIVKTGLFQPRVLVKDGIFYLVDLEQPNNFNGNLFRYQLAENPKYAENHRNEYRNATNEALRVVSESKALEVPAIKQAVKIAMAELRQQDERGLVNNLGSFVAIENKVNN